ncbi:Pal1-domain-containing protein [Massarina eburnea CBS 473.64]|uniref:Pal1-domain-containing protein n=1 Tax=Massarina eburnea CBS 473.64 TaxID=1395130 RepID=A0A6A6RIA3_9PLEO|nr:Pal1-domain-containing protein [Massarina eburnea CBS 473.64]
MERFRRFVNQFADYPSLHQNNLTLDDDGDKRRPAPARPAVPQRSGTLPLGGHRPSRSDEEERERRPREDEEKKRVRAPPRGHPRHGASGSRPRGSPDRRERRPRRNSESSIIDKGSLDPHEERRRRQRRREREERAKDGKDGKSGSGRVRKPHGLDVIDKLDVSGIYGPSMIHHDGPYDAVRPHRNRKKDQRAPMEAFPLNSANNALGGSGPVNDNIDLDQFHGRGAEGFSDFGAVAAKRPGADPRTQTFGPKERADIIHGDLSNGLGTSTFLEGAPASRAAIAERETEARRAFVEGGIGRKKSMAQRFRGISQPRRDFEGRPRIASPGTGLSPNAPLSGGGYASSKNNEANPFFDTYEEEYEKKGTAIKIAETENRDGLGSPSSPGGRNGLTRATTSDSLTSPRDLKPQAEGGGFLNRMKKLEQELFGRGRVAGTWIRLSSVQFGLGGIWDGASRVEITETKQHVLSSSSFLFNLINERLVGVYEALSFGVVEEEDRWIPSDNTLDLRSPWQCAISPIHDRKPGERHGSRDCDCDCIRPTQSRVLRVTVDHGRAFPFNWVPRCLIPDRERLRPSPSSFTEEPPTALPYHQPSQLSPTRGPHKQVCVCVMTSQERSIRTAEPLIAAHLLGDEVLEGLFDGVAGVRREGPMRSMGKLGLGVRSVDEALEGGVEEGRVVGVSCVVGGVGVEVCLTLLANSLLGEKGSVAVVVDTSGNFDVLLLYNVLASRVRADSELLGRLGGGGEGVTAEGVAAEMLDRVKIMRVFDLVGVMEAVGEVRDALEGRMGPVVLEEKKEMPDGVGSEKRDEVEASRTLARKTEIADSEDEEDEILFESETETATTYQTQLDNPTATVQVLEPDLMKMEGISETEGKVTFILIDNLAHVVNPLLKKDYAHSAY